MEIRETLMELIDERENTYDKLTHIIFHKLSNCREAIQILFDGIFDDFQWIDVTFHIEEETILITAHAKYSNPIATVTISDGTIEVPTIDDDGIPLTKEIFIGIPFEMAENSSANEIYHFLAEIEARRENPSMFSIDNKNGDMMPLDPNDGIFDEVYAEIEKSRKRTLH